MGCVPRPSPAAPIDASAARFERVGLRRARRTGARPPRRWSRPPAAATSTCSGQRRQLPRRPARPRRDTRALARAPLRVHQDIVVSTQMLVDPGDTVLLLPAATRYEQPAAAPRRRPSGASSSPRDPGPARRRGAGEWEIFLDVARRVDPERARLVGIRDAAAIREEIARVVPAVRRDRDAARERRPGAVGRRAPLRRRRLRHRRRPRALQRGPPGPAAPCATLPVSTRRGKQFNSMV